MRRVLATLLVLGSVAGCGSGSRSQDADRMESREPRTIEEVLEAHSHSLMAVPGVVGTAIGLCDSTPCIRVFLLRSSDAARRAIPEQLEGYRVKIEVSGRFTPSSSPQADSVEGS